MIRILEQRIEKPFEFIAKTAFPIEKQHVYIGRKRFVRMKHIHIIRYASHYHVILELVVKTQFQTAVLIKFRAFAQIHRTQFQLCGHPSVKSSYIVQQFVLNPCRSRTAHYQQELVPACAPTVPEMFERRQETGFLRIEPRQFVNKDHHTLSCPDGCYVFEKFRQSFKSFVPILRRQSFRSAVFQ